MKLSALALLAACSSQESIEKQKIEFLENPNPGEIVGLLQDHKEGILWIRDFGDHGGNYRQLWADGGLAFLKEVKPCNDSRMIRIIRASYDENLHGKIEKVTNLYEASYKVEMDFDETYPEFVDFSTWLSWGSGDLPHLPTCVVADECAKTSLFGECLETFGSYNPYYLGDGWYQPSSGYLTSPYGEDNTRRREPHLAIDFAPGLEAEIARPEIHAVSGGKVIFAGFSKGRGGNVVKIDHGPMFGFKNCVSRYAHLSKIAVAKDDYVQGYDVIGVMGNTGKPKPRSLNGGDGTHLHFTLVCDEKESIDPTWLFEHEGDDLPDVY